MPFIKDVPYNDLAHLPPIIDYSDKELQDLLESCEYHLLQLNIAYDGIENPNMLINTVGLKQAKASSHIENIITTNDKLYTELANKREDKTQQVRDVFAYNKALFYGYNQIQKKTLDLKLISEITGIIKRQNIDVRNRPNYIFSRRKGLIYTPPDNLNVIQSLLYNLFEYINDKEDRTHPLIKMAVIHGQFEHIHPYMDGNGRAGRILNLLYLCQQGIIPSPILTLSNSIKDTLYYYYSELQKIGTTNRWESWIKYMLANIQVSAIFTTNTLNEISKQIKETKIMLKKSSILNDNLIENVVNTIYYYPFCRKSNFEGLNQNQTEIMVTYLIKHGLLKVKKIEGDSLLVNQPLYELLIQENDYLQES